LRGVVVLGMPRRPHAHRLAERQPITLGAVLDRLELLERPAQPLMVDLDPFPRMRTSPSDCASSRLISAWDRLFAVERQPPSQKSSRAFRPQLGRRLAATVAFTCGRAGRFMRQLAGIPR